MHDQIHVICLQWLALLLTCVFCVVFSQSLFTLGLIEEYLAKQNVPGTEEMWMKNKNYFRMLHFFCFMPAAATTHTSRHLNTWLL